MGHEIPQQRASSRPLARGVRELLGAGTYVESVFDAYIDEEDLEIPEDEIIRQVRRNVDRLVPRIEGLVEGVMAFEVDVKFDRYRSDADEAAASDQ